MIGDKIRNVLDSWREAIVEGRFNYPDFEAGCVELRDAARIADRLEARPVPRQQREFGSDDAADPVVSLKAWRSRIPAAPHRRPAGPNGGPAA